MSQYRPWIRDKCYVVIKLFHNFEARLCVCYYITMNNPHLPFFAKLARRCWNVAISKSRRRYEFDIAGTTLYRSWHCNIDDMMWGEFISKVKTTLAQRCDLTSQYRRCEDVVILTSQFQSCKKRCQYTINSTPWVKPTNIDETLEERCNFDVVTSTSLQCCALVVRFCDLTTTLSQRCVFAEEVIRSKKLIFENDQIVKIFTKHFLETVGSYLQSQKVWASIIQNLDMAEKKLPFGIDCWQFKHL